MDYWEQKIVKTSATVSLRNNFGFVLILCLLACHGKENKLPYYNTADFTPIFLNEKDSVSNLISHSITDFNALDQHGQRISQRTIENKIHVADFFFTSCTSICPNMTRNLKLVSDVFEKDTSVVLLSFSVAPWVDSVAILKQYAHQMKIQNPNWHLLTGKKSETYELARKSYFAEENIGFNKDSSEFLHTEHFILVDRQKHIRGIYNGTLRLEMQQLIADVKKLEGE